MLALALANWRYIAVAGVIAGLLGWHWNAVRIAKRDGYQSALHDINAEALRLNKEADEGSKTVQACFDKGEPWVWDRGAGKCVKQ